MAVNDKLGFMWKWS